LILVVCRNRGLGGFDNPDICGGNEVGWRQGCFRRIRRSFQSGFSQSGFSQSGLVQPKRVQPKRVQPKRVQLERVQLKRVQPKRVQPKRVQPKRVQPKRAQPKQPQPKQVQPVSATAPLRIRLASPWAYQDRHRIPALLLTGQATAGLFSARPYRRVRCPDRTGNGRVVFGTALSAGPVS